MFGDQTAGRGRRFLASRPLVLLGTVSLGFYLFHLAFLGKAQEWLGVGDFGGSLPTVFAITFVCSVGLAFVSYYVVERPFLRLKDRSFRSLWRREPPSPPSPGSGASAVAGASVTTAATPARARARAGGREQREGPDRDDVARAHVGGGGIGRGRRRAGRVLRGARSPQRRRGLVPLQLPARVPRRAAVPRLLVHADAAAPVPLRVGPAREAQLVPGPSGVAGAADRRGGDVGAGGVARSRPGGRGRGGPPRPAGADRGLQPHPHQDLRAGRVLPRRPPAHPDLARAPDADVPPGRGSRGGPGTEPLVGPAAGRDRARLPALAGARPANPRLGGGNRARSAPSSWPASSSSTSTPRAST